MFHRWELAGIAPSRLILLALAFVLAGRDAPAGAAPGQPARLALLIGIGSYPRLGPRDQLEGCKNDVEAMKDLLVGRYGFAEADVVLLRDGAATGDAIRAGLNALLRKVRLLPPGSFPAQVVIHYSGHGSQARDQPEGHADRDEDDGYDETLLPHDAQPGPARLRHP